MKQKLDPKVVWLFFIKTSWQGLLALLIFGIVSLFIPGYTFDAFIPGLNTLLAMFTNQLWISLLILVPFVLLYAFISAKLAYHFFVYELTEDGFRKEYGIISKKYTSIPYERIQNVDIHRGFFARILGISDLRIQTAGVSMSYSEDVEGEGTLPGLSAEVAEQLRTELIRRSKSSKHQAV